MRLLLLTIGWGLAISSLPAWGKPAHEVTLSTLNEGGVSFRFKKTIPLPASPDIESVTEGGRTTTYRSIYVGPGFKVGSPHQMPMRAKAMGVPYCRVRFLDQKNMGSQKGADGEKLHNSGEWGVTALKSDRWYEVEELTLKVPRKNLLRAVIHLGALMSLDCQIPVMNAAQLGTAYHLKKTLPKALEDVFGRDGLEHSLDKLALSAETSAAIERLAALTQKKRKYVTPGSGGLVTFALNGEWYGYQKGKWIAEERNGRVRGKRKKDKRWELLIPVQEGQLEVRVHGAYE